MNKKQHARSCELAFGQPYHEVHEFLDQYSGQFPRQHRKAYHHRQGLERIRARFGPEAVKAAELHIREDEGFVPDDHTHFHTDKAELLRLVDGLYPAADDASVSREPAAGGTV